MKVIKKWVRFQIEMLDANAENSAVRIQTERGKINFKANS